MMSRTSPTPYDAGLRAPRPRDDGHHHHGQNRQTRARPSMLLLSSVQARLSSMLLGGAASTANRLRLHQRGPSGG